MALVPVTHKPVTAKARQFDGTLDAFLDILGARSPAGVVATVSFDGDGTFSGLQVSGGEFGGGIGLTVSDWAVFPDDIGQPPLVIPSAHAIDFWQVT